MKLLMSISGKGGVGKSLIAGNIAYGLVEEGKKVALMDVDYSNPNLAELLRVEDELLLSPDKQRFQPILLDNGIEFFSMAGICQNRPVSMEGSMYSQILRDVLTQEWSGEYGILDMPAGIADQFLEVVNVFAEDLLGSVVVFQPAHVKSARRMLKLHRNEGVPVLGLVENMAWFKCPSCGEKHYIFGEASVQELVEEFQVTPLGVIPLSMEIRRGVEKGNIEIPNFVACPVCGSLVKSQGRHGHFKTAHPKMDYHDFTDDWSPNAVQKAVNIIINSKPLGITFKERVKEKLKGFTRGIIFDVLAAVVEIANEEVNLGDIQKRHAFSGGRLLEVDITDKTLRNVKNQVFLRLQGGVWKLVRIKEEEDPDPHDEVRVWDRAFIWSLLGYRTDTGVNYDLMDAVLSGKAKYGNLKPGPGTTQRAVRVLRDVWSEVREKPGFQKIKPLLEKIG